VQGNPAAAAAAEAASAVNAAAAADGVTGARLKVAMLII